MAQLEAEVQALLQQMERFGAGQGSQSREQEQEQLKPAELKFNAIDAALNGVLANNAAHAHGHVLVDLDSAAAAQHGHGSHDDDNSDQPQPGAVHLDLRGRYRAHVRTSAQCLQDMETSLERGLRHDQVLRARQLHGWNELEQEDRPGLLQMVLEQFDDLLVRILLGAAVLSFVIALFEGGGEPNADGEAASLASAFVEPAVILLILVVNALVGVWQESKAESALDALKRLQPKYTRCLRDGRWANTLEARELVPGDIVEIRVGDKVPADLRLLKLLSTTLRVDQSAVTGESNTVLKMDIALDPRQPHRISNKSNMLFSGTTISGGRGLALVVSTGMHTEIGEIQRGVAAVEDERTPLKIKLDEFGQLLTKVIAAICVLVWIINIGKFADPSHGSLLRGCIYYLKIAVALGVAAIPEGLPAVITLCLALGTRRMVRKNCIVRKLPSVETLGCVTTICSDKTGTLTLNQMTVTHLVYLRPGGHELGHVQLEGDGYSPVLSSPLRGLELPLRTDRDRGLVECQRVAALCNDAQICWAQGKFDRVGEPTEAALRVFAERLGRPQESGRPAPPPAPLHDPEAMASHVAGLLETRYTRVAVLEFSRGRRSMGVLCRPEEPPAPMGRRNANHLFVKGAPESVIARCTHARTRDGATVLMTDHLRRVLLEQVDELARVPLRTLALAMKTDLGPLASYDGSPEHPAHRLLTADPDQFAVLESGMTWLGLLGIQDPPRPETRLSIMRCQQAGIRVIMITGDKQETADGIARQVGIFGPMEEAAGRSWTGQQFMALPREEQLRVLAQPGGLVFSRTEPRDKQRLVQMLRRDLDEVPAMTGDGVNDSPALKAASIGIAMGLSGTEVAKEASDMVLADDNFATIVAAIEEGRSIYQNMKAFIRYLVSSNIGEVASIFLTAMLGLPEGLNPVQLLWVNLVTDSGPALGLGFNPVDRGIMRQPPRRRDDVLIDRWVFFRYLVIGIYVGLATVGVFAYWYMFYDWAGDGHTLVSFRQLANWDDCPNWTGFWVNNYGGMDFSGNPCAYFTQGKVKASTLSLTVLVTIEMFNALNALSENHSLFQLPPWANPMLLLAIGFSLFLHLVILYVPVFAATFGIVPLTAGDWWLVLWFSLPVLALDELLKLMARRRERLLYLAGAGRGRAPTNWFGRALHALLGDQKTLGKQDTALPSSLAASSSSFEAPAIMADDLPLSRKLHQAAHHANTSASAAVVDVADELARTGKRQAMQSQMQMSQLHHHYSAQGSQDGRVKDL